MIRIILILWLALFISGCDKQSKPEVTIPVLTGDNRITDLLIKKLEENNDWYRVVNKSTIEIKYPPPSYVIGFVNDETNKIIPSERSSLISLEFRNGVIKELDSRNINYHLVDFGGENWLVWEEKDSDKINQIINTVVSKTLK